MWRSGLSSRTPSGPSGWCARRGKREGGKEGRSVEVGGRPVGGRCDVCVFGEVRECGLGRVRFRGVHWGGVEGDSAAY